jgi:gamma-glutamyltranspeptidase/glutathione hydrolase
MTTKAIIAAGHEQTAHAAATVIADGGNAFDGAVAALAAACVAEPVLASLGGGGFLHARPAGGEPLIYDFFVQTPRTKADPDGLDFYPILADFGDTVQEFHIGMGAIATPGAIAGLFAVQRDLCRLPPAALLEPARRMAERGVPINAFQHRIATIVEPILRAHPEVFALHASRHNPDRLAEVGERLPQPDLASALVTLGSEGPDLLYGGDAGGPWGQRLAADCTTGGGHLSGEDLASYRVERREPLAGNYRDAMLYLNPPPSLGGMLIHLTLDLLSQQRLEGVRFGSAAHRHLLATAMRLTQDLRAETDPNDSGPDPALLARYRALMRDTKVFRRGTTQISIADAEGNLASMTLSNGEGAGYLLPGTGIMLNNMLGEEDLNPRGFHRWATDRRIGSMMCPALVAHADGGWSVLGSSGSNRIRSAIVQVLSNLIDLRMPLDEAVAAARIHYENGTLNLEPPCDGDLIDALRGEWPDILAWSAPSVFFGGAHCVAIAADGAERHPGTPGHVHQPGRRGRGTRRRRARDGREEAIHRRRQQPALLER